MLEKIFKKHGIKLKDVNGNIRNVVDVLEDMYLKLSPAEFSKIMFEIMEEEKYANVFDDLRGRSYKGDE